MTPSEHAALSAELARALGWRVAHSDFRLDRGVLVIDPAYSLGDFRWFDYRRPDVCLPLIEWLAQPYGSFLCVPHEDSWIVLVTRRDGGDDGEKQYRIDAATIPEAVARAVIAVKGKS